MIQPFGCIIADPPWRLNDQGSRIAPAYPTMSLNELSRLGPTLTEIVADDAYLILWVLSAILEDGLIVARAWGFEPKATRPASAEGRAEALGRVRGPARGLRERGRAMETTQLPGLTCPACKRGIEKAPRLEAGGPDYVPKVGDLMVCLGCDAVLEWTSETEVKAMPSDEQAALPGFVRAQIASLLDRHQRARHAVEFWQSMVKD